MYCTALYTSEGTRASTNFLFVLLFRSDAPPIPGNQVSEAETVSIRDELWFVVGSGPPRKVNYLKDWSWQAAPDYPVDSAYMGLGTVNSRYILR